MVSRFVLAVVLLAAAMPATVSAQFFFENFDSYANGSPVVGQGGWEGWDNDPNVSGTVTSAQSYSPPNSLLIAATDDTIHQFAGITTGHWYARARVYVPSGMTGQLYFILLNTYNHGGPYDWSVQIWFDSLVVHCDYSGGEVPGVFNAWADLMIDIDLGTTTYNVYYNGTMVNQTGPVPWGNPGIQAVDLFSPDCSGGYFDNVWLDTTVPVELQSFTIE